MTEPENWERELRPILIEYIEKAMSETIINAADSVSIIYPWVGDKCHEIMADAAICVLRGMEDMEEFLRKDGLLNN